MHGRVINRTAPAWLEFAVETLGPTEFRRRLWHFAPGVLALGGAALPSLVAAPGYQAAIMVLFALGLAVAALCFQQSIRRAGERNCLVAILGYGVIIIPMFVIFPSHPELALTVAGVVAFGDGSATLVGLLFGERKLPWNQRKSWVGTLAFILIGLPLATSIYWTAAVPHISLEVAVLCVAPTVLMAAAIETLPTHFNDNLFVGVSAAVTVIVMQGLIVGW
jgi:dolichol kinase